MGNKPPTLSLTVTPTTIKLGEMLDVDLTGTTDPEGKLHATSVLLRKEGTEPELHHVGILPSVAGQYEVLGEAEDANGKHAEELVIVTVEEGDVEVPVAPTITVQPESVEIEPGQSALLTVVATGTEPVSYAWIRTVTVGRRRRSAKDIQVGNEPSITVSPAQTASYFCRVSNLYGTVDSQVATVAVVAAGDAPVITDQPESVVAVQGQTVTFEVVAAGTEPFSYQWTRDGADIPDAVASTYSTAIAGNYRCRVSNEYGSVESELATLTITIPPPIPSDTIPPPRYLGPLRLDTNGIYNTQLAYGGLAGRLMPNGDVRLYMTGNASSGPPEWIESIIQVDDPGTGYTTDINQSPILPTYYYQNQYRSHRGTYRRGMGPEHFDHFENGAFAANGSLVWVDPIQQLLLTFTDTYDVTSSQLSGLMGIELIADPGGMGFGTTRGYGPWSLQTTDGMNRVHRGPRRGGYIGLHPNGTLMCGGTLISGNADCSWGPYLAYGASIPTYATPVGYEDVIVVPHRGLGYYFMGPEPAISQHEGGAQLRQDGTLLPGMVLRSFRRRLQPPPHEQWDGNEVCGMDPTLRVDVLKYSDAKGPTSSWADIEFCNGIVYAHRENKAGYLFTANLIDGHNWYMNGCKPTCPSHGVASPIPVTGPCTTSAFPSMICYAPTEIQRVLDGEIQDFEAEPAWCVNVEKDYGVVSAPSTASGAAKSMNCGVYIPEKNRLYTVCPRADLTRTPEAGGTLIHVWELAA